MTYTLPIEEEGTFGTAALPYDVIIVGAGPAGLSAARTSARLGFVTLVIDRLSGPEALPHTCHAVLDPIPGIMSAREMFGGLFYPQIDLWIPDSLITLMDVTQRCISPSGYEYQTICASDGAQPVAVIDKRELLVLLRRQAESVGAEFRYNSEALGLLYAGDNVVGVRTADGDLYGGLVIAAEGAMGHLCEEAGCTAPRNSVHRPEYRLIINLELDAPAVGAGDLGRLITLGRQAAVGRSGYASVLMSEPGRAHVMFVSQANELTCATGEASEAMFAHYQTDPRVARLLAGASLLHHSSYVRPVHHAPRAVVANGFIGVGDSVTSSGQIGILPAIFMGRQAALIAAEALDGGSVSKEDLNSYERLYQGMIMPMIDGEERVTSSLLAFHDAQLDRLSDVLNALHLPVPFMGHIPEIEWTTVDLLLRQLPLTEGDCGLLQEVMGNMSMGA